MTIFSNSWAKKVIKIILETWNLFGLFITCSSKLEEHVMEKRMILNA